MTTWKSRSSIAVALIAALSACPEAEEPEVDYTAPLPSASPTITGVVPRWDVRAPAPTARLEVASAVVRGELYLAGGLLEDGVTNRVEVYNAARDEWRRAPGLPIAVHHAMGVSWRGRFVVLGGFATGGFSDTTDRVFVLSAEGWDELPRLGRPRAAGGAVVIDGSIYAIGGQGGGALVPATERFDGTRWIDAAAIPTPRDHLAVTTDGRFAYAVVGRRLSIDAPVTAFERYDPTADAWRRLPDAPTARGGVGAAFVDGSVVVVGGEGPGGNADGVFEEVEAFEVAARRWRELAPMRTPRHGIGVGVIDGVLLVAVGGPRLGGSVSRTLEAMMLARPGES